MHAKHGPLPVCELPSMVEHSLWWCWLYLWYQREGNFKLSKSTQQPIYGPGRQVLNYPVQGPTGNFSHGAFSTQYAGNPSTMAIYAQPCSQYGCGPWAWYGAGSSLSCVDPFGHYSCPTWWNTPYGQVGALY